LGLGSAGGGGASPAGLGSAAGAGGAGGASPAGLGGSVDFGCSAVVVVELLPPARTVTAGPAGAAALAPARGPGWLPPVAEDLG